MWLNKVKEVEFLFGMYLLEITNSVERVPEVCEAVHGCAVDSKGNIFIAEIG